MMSLHFESIVREFERAYVTDRGPGRSIDRFECAESLVREYLAGCGENFYLWRRAEPVFRGIPVVPVAGEWGDGICGRFRVIENIGVC